ncbi:MAG: Hint domain-containing protein [Yoonia sp.]|uniref:Hint domain-containing protein n=1 Tax=Yoonia sp. TaxID=2212373 RepID=UPI003EF4E035
MVQFNFNLAFYAFDDFSGDVATTDTIAYPVGTMFSLNAGSSPIVVNVTDDDNNPAGSPDNAFSDGFVDTPGNGSLPPATENNDQLLTDPVTVNGTTYPAGSQIELEFAFTTTTGETFWVIRIGGDNVGISGPSLPEPGTSYEVAESNETFDGQSAPISSAPCFLKGTKIKTPNGEVPVEDLAVGDMVSTLDHGGQTIRWITGSALEEADLLDKPNLRPIRIQAGALGANRPARTLVVSPQHRILIRSKIAIRMFESEEVLVPAKKLLELDGVEIADDIAPVWYFHFMCDEHEIIEADGAHAETLFLGPEAVKSVSAEALEEIISVFGDQVLAVQSLARIVPSGKQARRLVERHKKNHKAIYSADL